jgi:hypothetical protein
MFKKIIFIALMVCTLFTISHAQNLEGVNARIDAMGGEGISDDIGWTYLQPRNYIKFPNQIQGNVAIKQFWDNDVPTFRRLFFTKSIGDRVVLGGTLNNALIMTDSYYTRGFEFMKAYDLGLDPSTLITYNLPVFPHLGANIKITDNINIGVLGFYEGAKAKREYKIPDSSGTAYNTSSMREREYNNFGFVIDANIGMGKVFFCPRFRMAFPNMTGKNDSTSVLSAVLTERKVTDYDREYANWLQGGFAAGYVGFKYPIIGGFFFNHQKLQFNGKRTVTQNDGSTVFDSTMESIPIKENVAVIFLGTEIGFGDGLRFIPEVDMIYIRASNNGLEIDDSAIVHQDTLNAFDVYKFRIGMEKIISTGRFFDEIIPRAGFVYTLSKYIRTITDKDGNTDIENNALVTNEEKFAGNRGSKITAGLGFRKGRSTLDFSADLINWGDGNSPSLTGPRAAILTFTFDIGKKKGSKKDDDKP